MIEPLTSKVTEYAIERWLEAYRKKRVLTLVLTGVGTLILAGIVAAGAISAKRAEEARREANASYTQQIETLNNTEANLRNLIEFVESERQRLREFEKNVEGLRNEEKLLKPIVESDRKVVESILEVKNREAQENASRERWIGFGLGILASLVASILYAAGKFIIAYRKRRRRGSESAADSPETAI